MVSVYEGDYVGGRQAAASASDRRGILACCIYYDRARRS